MSQGFRIAPNLILPAKIAKQVTGIVGKRESGKTYNGSVLAEEIVKAGIPIVVIDGMGIWWGLRVGVKYVGGKQVPDPDKPGLRIVVFGGDHADIPLPMMRGQRIPLVPDPDKIRLMATSIVESGINAVIDTSALPSKAQEMTVVVEFIQALQRANRDYGVRTIFLEEAEVVAPQQPMRDEVLCLHVMNNLVKRGGNWNLGCVLMTQRAASINKNILTQSDMLMIGRLTAPQDKAAIQEWVKKAAETDESKKQLEKWYDSLNELDRGEMWVWKPDPPKIRVKTKFRLRETLHATREFLESPDIRKVKMLDVEEYKAKFLKLFEPPKPKPVEKPRPIPVVPVAVKPSPEPNLSPLVQEAIRELHSISKPGTELQLPPSRSFEQHGEKFHELPSQPQTFLVEQTLPNVIYQRNRPDLLVPDEPSSPIGRVLNVLMKETDKAGNKLWTGRGITEALATYQYPADGLEEAIRTLIHWEFLEPVMKGTVLSYRFQGRERIQLQDIKQTLQAA